MTLRSAGIFGSTGSIGVSTLELLEHTGDSSGVQVTVLTAGRNVKLLIEQARRWRPRLAVIADESLFEELKEGLAGTGVEAAAGNAAVIEAAQSGLDWVMAAIVGCAGLGPTLAAARTGAVIALANKESLVCAGPALLKAARDAGGAVLPVDSEHSAIFQVLAPEAADRVARLILTASGGPFRTWSAQEMSAATPEQAVAHPKWNMGAKISVDSATMMNKGLEMIEASYLFATPETKIDVLVHPQSIVHSLVEYEDGSTLAQLGPPDMKSPISCALSWPKRLSWPAQRLDLAKLGSLTFEAPDLERFPGIATARDALRRGEGAPAALNAANECAVAAFLDRRIGFLDIASTVAETLDVMEGGADLAVDPSSDPLETAMQVDRSARRVATELLSRSAYLN